MLCTLRAIHRCILLILAGSLSLSHCWAPCGQNPGISSRRTSVAVRMGRSSGYSRAPGSGDCTDVVNEAQVESILQEREWLRRNRRYDEADKLRDELDRMGVQLWDQDAMWTLGMPIEQMDAANERRAEKRRDTEQQRDDHDADWGQESGTDFDSRQSFHDAWLEEEPRETQEPKSRQQQPREDKFNEWGHDYSRADEDDAELLETEIDAINEILRDRLEAKFTKDFGKADALMAQLEESYGVVVNDGTKLWRADGLMFSKRIRQVGSKDAEVDRQRVIALIHKRIRFKKDKKYKAADEILDELLLEHGVVLNDKECTWRFVGNSHDGQYGEGSTYGRRVKINVVNDYTRRRDDRVQLSERMLDEIEELLGQRRYHKKKRNFKKADQLQQQLVEMGVQVNDKGKQWFMAPAADNW
mmetsp:Transcript_22046/g.40494  ORF Transcript_22046/g.40494 Transcript_22046/m.40494 type:complete len:415 (+) Transcript_22046:1-1245(+)